MNFDKLPERRPNKSVVRARRLRWIVFGALVVIAAVVFGLNRAARQNEVREEHRANATVLREQLHTAQADYAEVLRREAPLAERIASAERLLKAQRAFADTSSANLTLHAADIRRTEAELDRWRVQEKTELSLARERAAEAATAQGDHTAAAAFWREAWQLQREVNRSGPGQRNLERELRLEREIVRLTAEPLQQSLREKLARAQQAVAQHHWDEALVNYREARELQERLNHEFPRTRYSDLAAIGRIDAEIASLSADNLVTHVSAKMAEARELAAAGRQQEADQAFAEAAEAQRTLNERFNRSRFVSMERSEEIEAERQTAQAAELLREAARLRDEAERHLRRREIFQAQQSIREALARVDDVAARLPRARGLDESTRMQLGFLNVRAADLAALQDRLYEQLVPLPGRSDAAMLRAEVLQADFVRLMSANPSRNPGRVQPVDSVTFAEAEDFCRRASWVMGWRVRLPSLEEMRAAAPSGDFQNVTTGLDEWLAGEPGATAPVLAGEGRVQPAPKTERSRQRGFRVVVEVDLGNPGA